MIFFSVTTKLSIIRRRCEYYICRVKKVHKYWIGLGSNLGDRHLNLAWAVDRLDTHGAVLRKSGRYENPPAGFDSDEVFQNAVVEWASELGPMEALSFLKGLEQERGFRPTRADKGYADRYLDLDILWWSGGIFNHAELVIPHPHLLDRAFVVIPLEEMIPNWTEIMGVQTFNSSIFGTEKMNRIGSL